MSLVGGQDERSDRRSGRFRVLARPAASNRRKARPGKSYRLREVKIEQSVTVQTAEIQLSSFRYMDVELLSGEFETDSFKVHILLLYKEGADTYQYLLQTQGDIIAAELSFSFDAAKQPRDPLIGPSGRKSTGQE